MKNRLGYLFLLLIFVGVFIVFQSFGILVIIGLLIVLPVLAFFLCRQAAKEIEVSIATTGEILEKNQEFPVTIILRNRSYIPVLDCFVQIGIRNGFMEQGDCLSFHLPVPAKGGEEKVIPICSKYCGRIEMQILKMEVYDFLHLFYKRKKAGLRKNVLIFPFGTEQIEINDTIYTSGNDDAVESHTKGSDFSDVSDIREYIPGDSLKDIHWKLSAKKDDFMVKEHVSLSSRQIAFFIELFNDEFGFLDGILEQAFSIGKRLLAERRGFTFYWWSELSGCVKEKSILTEHDLFECFQELFFEKPYVTQGKGLKHFKYQEYLPECIMVIDKREGFSRVEVSHET